MTRLSQPELNHYPIDYRCDVTFILGASDG